MLWPNLGATAVEISKMQDEIAWYQSYGNKLKNIWSAGALRRDMAVRRQRMYDHDWKDQLDEELKRRFRPETVEKLSQVADYSLNVLAWVVRKIAGIYKKPCVRSLDTAESHPRIDAWLKESMHQLAMLELCRLTNLHQDCLIGAYAEELDPTFRDEAGGVTQMGRRRIQYRLLTPDRCEVLVNDDDSTKMEALIYSIWETDSTGRQKPRYIYWDNYRYREYDEMWNPVVLPDNPEGINPFGRIPFVAFHASFDTQRFWHAEKSQSLERANLSIASGLTDFWHSIKVNSFKQLALSGADFDNLDPGQVIDGAVPLDLGETGQATMLDYVVDQMDRIESIWQVASMIVHTHGINPKSFRGAQDGTSGYQLEVQNQDLAEVWAEQRILFEAGEQELYNVVRAVNNEYAELDELPEGTLMVEFDEVGPGHSPQEKLEFWGGAVEKKLSSHVRAIMALHDLTEEEATREWERIQEESRASMPVSLVPPMNLGEPEEDDQAPEIPAQMQPDEQEEDEAEA